MFRLRTQHPRSGSWCFASISRTKMRADYAIVSLARLPVLVGCPAADTSPHRKGDVLLHFRDGDQYQHFNYYW